MFNYDDSYIAIQPANIEDPQYDGYGPELYEEVDLQEWAKGQMVSVPQPFYSSIPEYTVVRSSGRLAASWGTEDYKEMSLSSPVSDAMLEPVVPQVMEVEIPAQAVDIGINTHTHTRVQVTQTYKNQYVKGESGNFEFNIPYMFIYAAIKPLLEIYPKRRGSDYKVRVQLQSKVNGKMSGGANLSLHNAHVADVMVQLGEIFDESRWLVVDPELERPLYIGDPAFDESEKPNDFEDGFEPNAEVVSFTKNSYNNRLSEANRIAEELAEDVPGLAELEVLLGAL